MIQERNAWNLQVRVRIREAESWFRASGVRDLAPGANPIA